jgi:hypothetical protein
MDSNVNIAINNLDSIITLLNQNIESINDPKVISLIKETAFIYEKINSENRELENMLRITNAFYC